MPNFISEGQIEQALVQKLQHLHGFDALDCYTENAEDLNDGSNRANKRDVILVERVREAAIHLNPDIPATAIEDALDKLLDRRQALTLIAANREIYGLLRDGIPVEFDNAQGVRQQELVRLLDFNTPHNNRYLAVTQLWIKGERGFRRPDVLLYVNGIPLVFIELKNSNVKLRNAFDDNLTTYKAELFILLDDAIEQGLAFCHEKEVALREVLGSADMFEKLGRFNVFANALLANDEWRKGFNVYENTITSLYEACKPEVLGRGKGREVAAFQYLRGVIDSLIGQTDIDAISLKIAELLDESVVVNDAEAFKARQYNAEYQIIQKGKTWDLSKINFDKLREEFKQATYKNIEIADLRAFLQHKIELMLQQNATRTDFAQRLQQIIDAYNSGGSTTENSYEELIKFTEDLRVEEERHIREGLTEDELELFDLLKKDKMTQEETQKVRLAAKSLLHRLLEEHPKVLVQDWYKDTQTQKQVRSAVEQVLDSNLPESYDRVLFREKCDNVFYLMLDYASHGRKWAAKVCL
ncbi:MAG: type I restriction endonuclease [Candidatus Nitrotoga sp.]|nr:type I restriction endonuclease [Candidatus Nitrotoga sp.]